MEFDVEGFRAQHYANKKVVVMGYGIYATGSGIAATEYLAKANAQIIVMDLRSQEVLAENIARLAHYDNIVWKVGVEHDAEDFKVADLVIKNPGVRSDSPYLKLAKVVESDISLFLREYNAMQSSRGIKHTLVAITGSKGKSSTVWLLHHLLGGEENHTFLAGNITLSPLFHLEKLSKESDATLILELSSWQLADLKEKGLLQADFAMLTNLMADHLNYYDNDMLAYAKDKANLFLEQGLSQYALFDLADIHTSYFVGLAQAIHGFYYDGVLPALYRNGAYWQDSSTLVFRMDGKEEYFCVDMVPNYIVRSNFAKALWLGRLLGLSMDRMQKRLENYKGLICRCQLIATCKDMRFINDSAATIPEATISAINNFYDPSRKLVLILGGAHKGSDLSLLQNHLTSVNYVYLLQGSASAAFEVVLQGASRSYQADWQDFDSIVADFMQRFAGESADLLLSPAVASFGLFNNEFDRGRAFDTAVLANIAE